MGIARMTIPTTASCSLQRPDRNGSQQRSVRVGVGGIVGKRHAEIEESTEEGERLAYSVREAADALGVGLNHLYECIYAGEVPAKRLGRKWLIPAAWLREMVGTSRHDEREESSRRSPRKGGR